MNKRNVGVNIGVVDALKMALLSLTVAMAACQKNDSNGSSGVVAQTPQVNCNIPGANPTACNPGYYNQYGWPNYNQPYGVGGVSTYGNGFCGCPAGYQPVMNSGWGFGCSPAYYGSMYGGSAYMGYSYNSWNGTQLPTVNGQNLNIPMSTYSVPNNFTAPQNNCYPFASQSCDVRIANSCNGGVCVASSAGSTIGVCQYTNTQAGTQSGCRTQYYNGLPYTVCSYNWSYNGNTSTTGR